jgi:hypothetical protein
MRGFEALSRFPAIDDSEGPRRTDLPMANGTCRLARTTKKRRPLRPPQSPALILEFEESMIVRLSHLGPLGQTLVVFQQPVPSRHIFDNALILLDCLGNADPASVAFTQHEDKKLRAGGLDLPPDSGDRLLSLRQPPDVVFKIGIGDAFLAAYLSPDGYPGLDHARFASGDQGMPPGERLATRQTAIGAAIRQPVELAGILRRQPHAVAHPLGSIGVVTASAGLEIEQLAGEIGEVDLARILILELDKTAAPAAVAQAFPFRVRHLGEFLRLQKG